MTFICKCARCTDDIIFVMIIHRCNKLGNNNIFHFKQCYFPNSLLNRKIAVGCLAGIKVSEAYNDLAFSEPEAHFERP
jgi:hypothetical protein